ncbi:hypothetical protein ABZ327_39560, partial [Streptomyces sp. NPDC006135]
AWQGLLELRRMTNRDGAVDRPCGWERTHLVQDHYGPLSRARLAAIDQKREEEQHCRNYAKHGSSSRRG